MSATMNRTIESESKSHESDQKTIHSKPGTLGEKMNGQNNNTYNRESEKQANQSTGKTIGVSR